MMRWWRGQDRQLSEVSRGLKTLQGKDRRALLASISAGAVGAATAAWAQQPSTVSNLPYASTPLSGGELTYVVQSGVSKKTPVSGLGIQQLSGLTDVSVVEPTTNGYVLTWSSALAKWISAAVGGGVNGLTTVTTKASLASTSPALGSVQMTLAGAVGLFTWVAGSFTSQVTSDPYQGLYVPLTGDPTGATGAWVRQFTGNSINMAWFTGIDTTGVADSTLPVQSAVNLAVSLGVKLMVPVSNSNGYIKITTSITYAGPLWLEGVDGFYGLIEAWSQILGNFNAPLFYRNGTLVTRTGIVGNPAPGVFGGLIVKNLILSNPNFGSNASCFQVYNVDWPLVFDGNVVAGANRGIELPQTFGALITNNGFAGDWFTNLANPISTVPYNNSVALMNGDAGGSVVIGNTMKNYGVGMRLVCANAFVAGNDVEVNGLGISVGGVSENQESFGGTVPFSGTLDSEDLESNYRQIDVYGLTVGTISNCRCAANGGSPAHYDPSIGNGNSQSGLTLFVAGALAKMENCNFNGFYTSWAVNYSGFAGYYNLKNVSGANSIANTPVVCGGTSGIATASATASSISGHENLFINDRIVIPTDTSDQDMSVFTKLNLMGLTQPNFTRAQIYPNNLMGQVSVANGASTAAVTFLSGITGGSAVINTIAASGSGHTLPAATYYYAVTLLGPNGETGVNLATTNSNFELQAVTTGQQVTITFFGLGATAASYLRRIYRFLQIAGAPAVVAQGFFETSATNTTFIDTGQAFTGYGMPPSPGVVIPTKVEKDNNYVVTSVGGMNWNHGGWWITSQSTAGFTINFANVNSGSAVNVTYLIGRP